MSRFGRNFIDGGQFMEYVLPAIGCRLVALHDNYDSKNRTSGGNEFIHFKDFFKYIFVMGIRYEHLNVELEFDDRLMGYSMPRMLLQPLIENAVMHGFDELDADSRILVKCELLGDAIFFTVSDNGCGMSAEKRKALNERLSARPEPAQGYMNVALLNIKDRLYHYFGDAGQVQIDSEIGAGTRVTISIPPIIREAEAWINEE